MKGKVSEMWERGRTNEKEYEINEERRGKKTLKK